MRRLFLQLSLPSILGCLFLLQGCVNLKPRENDTRFYVLGDASSSPTVPPVKDGEGLSIGLRRLQLASYLNTPRIVVRVGSNQVHFSDKHRWGEDLAAAINRVVAGYLMMEPSIHHVDVVPWTPGAQHDYVVEINVVQFEGEVIGSTIPFTNDESGTMKVHLVAHWHIVDPASNTILSQGTTDETIGEWSTDTYPNIVTNLGKALEKLTKDLVSTFESLRTSADAG